MKNLTKISMIALISLSFINLNAQTFGIKGGLNLANMLDKDIDEKNSDYYKMNPGYHIGATIDLPFNDFLSFESGLLLTTKGWKRVLEFELNESVVTFKGNLYYLDIPLTLKASHGLDNGLKIFGAVGPYFGIGLSGKIKEKVEYQGEKNTDEQEVKWGTEEYIDDYKRPDMGLTFGGGIEINSALIGLSFDYGLSNISPNQNNGKTIKNRVLKFSIGYLFGS